MSQTVAAGTFPGTNGKIAFVSNRDGNEEIYVMNPDGSNQQRLTNNPALDSYPSWSPDGTKIAFTSNRNGNLEIYVMNADGSNQVRLTNNASPDSDPTWAPDGKKITFVKGDPSLGPSDLYVMDSDGSNLQGITTSDPDLYLALTPSWSPDGAKIAFACYDDNGNGVSAELCMINSGGSNLSYPVGHCIDNFDEDPSWSPDGKKLAFTSLNRDSSCDNDGSGGYDTDILVFNFASATWYDILPFGKDWYGMGSAWQASWSPDGTKLVFICSCDEGLSLYIANPDGSNIQKLPAQIAQNARPDWGTSPLAPVGCGNPTMTGTDSAEVIEGTPGADIIDAKGGDDTIYGLGGNDVICGGSGNDFVYGGSGSDVLYGGYGNDILTGGTGHDEMNGGAGNDSLVGNGGSDSIFGNSGNDVLNGLDAKTYNDHLDGGVGSDKCNSDRDAELNCEIGSGAVAHWKFDEGTGSVIADSSGYGNSGSLLNNPSWLQSSECSVGESCLKFDGVDDYARVPRSTTTEPSSTLTIAMWVNVETSTGALIDKAYTNSCDSCTPTYSYSLQLEPKTGQPSKAELIWSISTWTGQTSIGQGSSEVLIDLNTWQHITVVYDASRMKEYVNGDLKASVSKSGEITYADGPLVIGDKNRSTDSFAEATIDDVRIFGRALTATEVEQLFLEAGH